ncbi:DUF6134 family protein [Phenylobacterium sp.]|uniref:DUF6134 family protein n=1 Tax=Phenylobacterium sp. TaxID=1871053 RepID=UPI002B583BCF|nr:DUF6134 family protein [Phenylobacterium sp.]HVI33346.1 DUF6134 family protein [Phenylobacterium sp.]
MDTADLSRRSLLAVAAGLAASPAWAAPPAGGRLAFAVFRKQARVGEHRMVFTRTGGLLEVVTEADMRLSVGPIPFVRYSHRARERWRDGRFESLETSSSTNGKRDRVDARREGEAVLIVTPRGERRVSARTAPLTHWNPAILEGPLFNPQTGAPLKLTTRREAVPPGARWLIRGEAEIDNWYDQAGVWQALRGKLPDGSWMEYRRL